MYLCCKNWNSVISSFTKDTTGVVVKECVVFYSQDGAAVPLFTTAFLDLH